MFIRIKNTHYFVLPEGKSALQLYEEIFGRMNKTSISHREKRQIIAEIRRQIKNGRNVEEE